MLQGHIKPTSLRLESIKENANDKNYMMIFLKDKAGRRSGIERRVFLYTIHIPERRSGKERRKDLDRRDKKEFKLPIDVERRAVFKF
jgi:hypothetical protein